MGEDNKSFVDFNAGFLMWDEASTRIGDAEVAPNQFAKEMDKNENNKGSTP